MLPSESSEPEIYDKAGLWLDPIGGEGLWLDPIGGEGLDYIGEGMGKIEEGLGKIGAALLLSLLFAWIYDLASSVKVSWAELKL